MNNYAHMENASNKWINFVKIIFFAHLFLSLIGLGYYSRLDRSNPMDNSAPVFINEWQVTDPDGREFTAGRSYRNNTAVRGTFTMISTLPNIEVDSDFCFITGGDVSVYVNGELRKDFVESRDVVVPGGCVKRFYMLVPVKSEDSGKEIKIERIGTTRKGYVYQDTFAAKSGDVFSYLMSRYGLSLMLAIILLIFALVIVVVSITMRILYRQRIEMLYGALGILVISGWIITNSYLYPFIFGHYHVDGVINYLLCLMLPFSLVFYLDALQNGRYRRIMNGVLCLGTASFIIWPILHFSCLFSFSRALIYINIILGIQILIVMGVLILETVRGKVQEYKYTAVGFAGFLICGLSEIVILNFFPTMHEELPMLIGLAFLLALAVVQQMDDLRKMRDERQRAVDLSQAKTRFLASMSHEIRTPINAVLGMNEMILRENRDPVIDEYARSVKSSGKMLLMLVNDVLDFSKIEAGKMEIAENEYSFSELLRDIMPILKERADEKHLKLGTLFLGEVPDRQISDEFRIRQILVNLINNAIKYTDKGAVTLMIGGDYTEEKKFLLKLRIKDTGRGISEEGQKHLFEAFTRADVKKNGNIEGTGLGLAIVKSIVDSMGGKIGVLSQYGEGSEFMVDLPVLIVNPEPVKEDFMDRAEIAGQSDRGSSYYAKDAKVLAVDDNSANLKIVSLFLKRVGIVPDSCDSGTKAIALCKEKKYDLILLDHMMPDPDGIETLHQIRSLPDSKNKDTKVIVLTANAVAGSRQLYLEAGFADYLTKPIEASLLEETIRQNLPPEKIVSAEEQTKDTVDTSALKERMTEIEGLDYQTAMNFAGNNEALLGEIVEEIANQCEEKILEMQNALAEEDLMAYRRDVHSLKGLMATIGLHDFGERAKRHEMAAKDGDLMFIRSDHEAFFAQYRDICEKLSGRS
ncbi:MAG: response regulator [Lachnospiraceae bacterium]|nr:response regulator [Lachnospiraceae bacterium]